MFPLKDSEPSQGRPFVTTGALPRWNEEETRRNVRLALDRMGATDESKARWLLSFASIDLTRLLPGRRPLNGHPRFSSSSWSD